MQKVNWKQIKTPWALDKVCLIDQMKDNFKGVVHFYEQYLNMEIKLQNYISRNKEQSSL